MEKVIVTLTGSALIGFIVWFFFDKKEEEASGNDIKILVDGGYRPSVIRLNKDVPAKITFVRRDKNACLEELVIPDFSIKEFLPLSQPVTVNLTPDQAGTFIFHCGMNMFKGKIKVS